MLALGDELMSKPRALVLDESSLGLAPPFTREIFLQIIARHKEMGVGILLVEQNAWLALQISDT